MSRHHIRSLKNFNNALIAHRYLNVDLFLYTFIGPLWSEDTGDYKEETTHYRLQPGSLEIPAWPFPPLHCMPPSGCQA